MKTYRKLMRESFGVDKALFNDFSVDSALFDKYHIIIYEIKPLEKRGHNYHFKLQTNSGKKCLKKYKGTRKKNNIVFEHSLIRYLIERGFEKIAKPVLTKNKKSFTKVNDNYYFISDWVENIYDYNTQINNEMITDAASTLARLHKLLEDFNPQIEKEQSSDPCLMSADIWMLKYEAFFERIEFFIKQELAGFSKKNMEDLKYIREQTELVNKAFNTYNYEEIKKYSPLKYVHGDYRPGNLAFRDNKVHRILDFDDLHREIRLYDVCFTSTFFGGVEVFGGIKDLRKVRLFLQAYNEKYPLTNEELNLLPWYMKELILRWISIAWRGFQFIERLKYYKQIDSSPNLMAQ